MRIRKNARLISSSSSSSFLVCQLNRSPWDVDSFSLQGEVEDEFGVSGNNFAQVIPSSDSLPSVESMELSFEYVENKLPPPPPPQQPLEILPLEMEIEGKLNVKEDKQMGCRNNDKSSSGWKYIQPPLPPVSAPPKKRGRPKKSASTAASTTATPAAIAATTTTATTTTTTNHNNNSNPYEFYYYSGFGPSWSKRRGNKYNTSTTFEGNYCNRATMNDVDDSPSSSASHGIVEDDRDDDDNKKSSNVIVLDRVIEGELDYIEDDFDDDDDESGGGGGRRIRKPVKARSLKSLM